MNRQTQNLLKEGYTSPVTKNILIEKISHMNDLSEKEDYSVNKSIQSLKKEDGNVLETTHKK